MIAYHFFDVIFKQIHHSLIVSVFSLHINSIKVHYCWSDERSKHLRRTDTLDIWAVPLIKGKSTIATWRRRSGRHFGSSTRSDVKSKVIKATVTFVLQILLLLNNRQKAVMRCGSEMFIPDPGFWLLFRPDLESWIQISDPGSNDNKRGGLKICCPTSFVAKKYHEIENCFIFWTGK